MDYNFLHIKLIIRPFPYNLTDFIPQIRIIRQIRRDFRKDLILHDIIKLQHTVRLNLMKMRVTLLNNIHQIPIIMFYRFNILIPYITPSINQSRHFRLNNTSIITPTFFQNRF